VKVRGSCCQPTVLKEQERRMENPPNQTIYINNLNEKVKKDGEC